MIPPDTRLAGSVTLSVRPELAETNTWRLTCGPSYEVFGRRHHERRLLHRRPASKKRQGTKSREAGQRLGSERYGDFRLAAHSMEARRWGEAMRMPMRERQDSEKGVSAGA